MRPKTDLINFQRSCSLLVRATQLDALSCINAAQRRVSAVLLQAGAGERLMRLAHADLIETLLARACILIAQDQSYPAAALGSLRERFLVAHLEHSLAQWLAQQACNQTEAIAAKRCIRVLSDRSA